MTRTESEERVEAAYRDVLNRLKRDEMFEFWKLFTQCLPNTPDERQQMQLFVAPDTTPKAVKETPAYLHFPRWPDKPAEFDDEELLEIYMRFQDTVNENDEGRTIQWWLTMYRDNPPLRDLLDHLMVALTGWRVPTIVRGMTEDGVIPDGLEQ